MESNLNLLYLKSPQVGPISSAVELLNIFSIDTHPKNTL